MLRRQTTPVLTNSELLPQIAKLLGFLLQLRFSGLLVPLQGAALGCCCWNGVCALELALLVLPGCSRFEFAAVRVVCAAGLVAVQGNA